MGWSSSPARCDDAPFLSPLHTQAPAYGGRERELYRLCVCSLFSVQTVGWVLARACTYGRPGTYSVLRTHLYYYRLRAAARTRLVASQHKANFPRPGHKNDLPPLYSTAPTEWATHGLPYGALNIAPVAAGDYLILSEATVHGILPWVPHDRLRRFLVLRYGMQYSGVQPLLNLPAPLVSRLSDTTVELMGYAHITHTKGLALEYCKSSAGPRL